LVCKKEILQNKNALKNALNCNLHNSEENLQNSVDFLQFFEDTIIPTLSAIPPHEGILASARTKVSNLAATSVKSEPPYSTVFLKNAVKLKGGF